MYRKPYITKVKQCRHDVKNTFHTMRAASPDPEAPDPNRRGNRIMSDDNVWFITGAARGMGIDIAQAALGAGHKVVATARDAANVTKALGEHENLLAVSLDITDEAAADAAAAAALERAASTCSSTTPGPSTPANSRRSAPRSSGPSSRRTSSAS
jgi:hypothetical protein